MGEARRKKQALERESQEPLSPRTIVRAVVESARDFNSDESAARRAAERKRGMHRRPRERIEDELTGMGAYWLIFVVIPALVVGAIYLVKGLAS